MIAKQASSTVSGVISQGFDPLRVSRNRTAPVRAVSATLSHSTRRVVLRPSNVSSTVALLKKSSVGTPGFTRALRLSTRAVVADAATAEEAALPEGSKAAKPRSELVVGIPILASKDERRVCATPDTVKVMAKQGTKVVIQTGAGVQSAFSDAQYTEAGATVVETIEVRVGPITMSLSKIIRAASAQSDVSFVRGALAYFYLLMASTSHGGFC
ncbi:hypothetical protein CYMTET_14274 [Cymbomonas tetramitiformis]|uniref:proton-translocating NAD(P)(+) transhydrogenase n=1 Tax=Cymbomonas tetramitiformis TaxID=36881 RepID=A0AAE0GGW9_9CHLO|nr:hypothetical protein CYMTET_14274 [Cymbomonas tetramitiformis]